MGRVRKKLLATTIHWSNIFPVRTRLPATSIPLVWGTIRSTICHALVPGEREGLGLSSPTPAERAFRRQKHHAELRRTATPTFQPGQKVWLSTRDIRLRLPCKKLSPRFIGPFPIVCQVNPVTYQLQLHAQYRIHPTFHSSLLKPYHSPVSTEPGPLAGPPLPIVLEDGTIYAVKEILNSRCRGGRLEYLVDWEGYGPEERSWVPRDDILDPNLLTEFHSMHPQCPAPRGQGHPPRRHIQRPSGAGRGGGFFSHGYTRLFYHSTLSITRILISHTCQVIISTHI